jgi:flagellar biosynthetic protein FliQ
MQPEAFVEVLSNALFLVIKLVAAIIVPSLLVGLIVAIFQAATSINEQTLSFLPRLVVTLLALIIGAHWITQQLMDFFGQMVEIIPQIAG